VREGREEGRGGMAREEKGGEGALFLRRGEERGWRKGLGGKG